MRIAFVGSLVPLLVGTGMALAQSPAPPGVATTAPAAGVASTAMPPAVQTVAPTAMHDEAVLPPAKADGGKGSPPPGVAASAVPVSSRPLADVAPACDGVPCWEDDCGCLKKLYPKGCTWVSLEYLLWWPQRQPTVPMVTTGPATVAPAQFGVLGSPGTTVVFGQDGIGYGATSGVRLMGGIQGPDRVAGIEGGAFLLEQKSVSAHFASDANGNPIIARPFVDAQSGAGSRVLTAAPGSFTGDLTASSTSRLWGGEVSLTRAIAGLQGDCSSFEIDLIGGVRYLDLFERLAVSQNSVILPGGVSAFEGSFVFAPTGISVADSFSAQNRFFGGQVGMEMEFQYCHFFIYTIGKVGLGVVHQVLDANGTSTMTPAGGAPVTVPGGLFALPSNIGRHTHDDFAAVPEVNINLGYQITRYVRVFAGYTYLYWSEVVRPGSQTNLNVTAGQLPTSPLFGQPAATPLPSPIIRRGDYSAHGLNFGLAVHF
jgi:hypothetical protein